MGLKLQKNTHDSIPIRELEDGQLAVITQSDDMPSYVGRIIQRHGDILVAIGLPSGCSWGAYFAQNTHHKYFRCRVLQSGEVLEVE